MSCARPCALLHDYALLKNLHLLQPLGWPWANLGCCLRIHRKTLMSTKACFRGKAFLGKPAKITFVENKDVNSWIKFRLYRLHNNYFAPALGGALNLSVSARLTNCNVATCWHVELSTLSILQLSFNIHLSNRFNCSIQFFLSKITLGLALGESWGVAYKKTLMSSVYLCLFSWDGFPGQTCKNHLRWEQGCKLMDQI